MSALDAVKSSKRGAPWRVLCYGVHGIGKSTLASTCPDPLVIPTEDGLRHIDVPAFPLVRDLATLRGIMQELIGAKELAYKTLVIDSADWLERLIWDEVAQRHQKAISEIPYQKGYEEAGDLFRGILKALDAVRLGKGINVFVTAHAKVAKFESPEGDSYDRWQPKLHKSACALLEEWVDVIAFANYKIAVSKKEEGFGRTRGVGIGDGERVLYLTTRPAWIAKLRTALETVPDEIEMSYQALAPYIEG